MRGHCCRLQPTTLVFNCRLYSPGLVHCTRGYNFRGDALRHMDTAGYCSDVGASAYTRVSLDGDFQTNCHEEYSVTNERCGMHVG
jgi:hypothetical protein